jgi:glycosyltransferase involved in cell wall biosynthesis
VVGRLTSLKGVHYLIRALPIAQRALGLRLTLDVLGTGPEEARLTMLARELGVGAQFHGTVEPASRDEVMRGADLLAVPSLWPEPFGLVGIEAGRLGLPAVGYAVGGIPEWLHAGQSGELAPGEPPTVEGLAEAIVRALQDPARHALLRAGAWEAAKRFTMDAHMRQLGPLLVEVAESRA